MPTTKSPAGTLPALDSLLAQRKQLDEQIKAARQSNQHTPIYVVKTLLPRIKRRMADGADHDTALDAELAEVRNALVNALVAPNDASAASDGE